MNNFSADELGRVVANAVSGFLRSSGMSQPRSETSQATPPSLPVATTVVRSNPPGDGDPSLRENTQIPVTSTGARPRIQTRLSLPVVLPSRYQSPTAYTTSTRRRTSGGIGRTKTWSKDVVCIPEKDYVDELANGNTIPIPRGEARGALAMKGLVGKIRIVSSWSPHQVKLEISSIFGKLFDLIGDELLVFDYLMVVKGTRRLKTPSVSSSFLWTGQEVASLAGQGCLYILAMSDLITQHETGEQDENIGEIMWQSEDGRTTADVITARASHARVNDATQSFSHNDSEIEITESMSTRPYRSYISLLNDEDVIDDDADDLCMQIALQESVRGCGQSLRPAVQDIPTILKSHQLKVMSSLEDVGRNYLNVRRRHVLSDGIQKMKRSSFQPYLPISVKFADDAGNSEGAVDTGGPTREFFRLGIKELFTKTNVFQGPDRNKVLVHNIQGEELPD